MAAAIKIREEAASWTVDEVIETLSVSEDVKTAVYDGSPRDPYTHRVTISQVWRHLTKGQRDELRAAWQALSDNWARISARADGEAS